MERVNPGSYGTNTMERRKKGGERKKQKKKEEEKKIEAKNSVISRIGGRVWYSLSLHLNGSACPSVLWSFQSDRNVPPKDHRPFCRVYDPLVGSRRVVALQRESETRLKVGEERLYLLQNEWKRVYAIRSWTRGCHNGL